MRNDSSNDINHDLSKDFMLMHSFQVFKSEIKNKYLEVCEMEKEKNLEVQAQTGDYQELSKFVSLVLCAQSDLKKDLGVDSTIVRMAFDAETFGSLDWVIQFCYCSDGTDYKRLISKHGATKFIRVFHMPGIGGQK